MSWHSIKRHQNQTFITDVLTVLFLSKQFQIIIWEIILYSTNFETTDYNTRIKSVESFILALPFTREDIRYEKSAEWMQFFVSN